MKLTASYIRKLILAALVAGIVFSLAVAIAAAHEDHSTSQWPTTCVALNDVVETHLGNLGNVGIYQRTFGDQAEAACQNDHRNDVTAVFGWAIATETGGQMEAADLEVDWPTTCVELNDIVEGHLGNRGNVAIYQNTFGNQAEAACQNDHRNDVRSVFAWAIGSAMPSAPTTTVDATGPQTWRGLVVASEDRCSPYDPDDYPYSQSVEQQIVENMGGIIYGPYTATWFDSTSQTDIEHIVARSEAHDSGLCAASAETKRQFASDLLNLTLASPAVNRHQKSGHDAAGWLPDQNRCWFANRVVEVRQRYGLTVDQQERNALENVLSGCVSTELVVQPSPTQTTPPAATPAGGPTVDALQLYDDDGNGRITCAEARRHNIAPVHSDHPAYAYMDDRDGDGIVCE